MMPPVAPLSLVPLWLQLCYFCPMPLEQSIQQVTSILCFLLPTQVPNPGNRSWEIPWQPSPGSASFPTPGSRQPMTIGGSACHMLSTCLVTESLTPAGSQCLRVSFLLVTFTWALSSWWPQGCGSSAARRPVWCLVIDIQIHRYL